MQRASHGTASPPVARRLRLHYVHNIIATPNALSFCCWTLVSVLTGRNCALVAVLGMCRTIPAGWLQITTFIIRMGHLYRSSTLLATDAVRQQRALPRKSFRSRSATRCYQRVLPSGWLTDCMQQCTFMLHALCIRVRIAAVARPQSALTCTGALKALLQSCCAAATDALLRLLAADGDGHQDAADEGGGSPSEVRAEGRQGEGTAKQNWQHLT